MLGNHSPLAKFTALALSLCGALGTVILYWPGLGGPFLFDDFPNIVSNSRIHLTSLDPAQLWGAAFSSKSSLFARPDSTATFAISYALGAGDPFLFKLHNLMLHLLTAATLAWLTLLLLRVLTARLDPIPQRLHRWIALSVALIWLVHPMHVSTTLYVVQRMTILSTLFTVLGLIAYVYARLTLARSRSLAGVLLLAFALFAALAFLSKESGILLPAYVLVLELTALRAIPTSASTRSAVRALIAAVACVPILAAILILSRTSGAIFDSYLIRDFTLGERLLTEGRVVVWYLFATLAPSPSQFALIHDVAVSGSLLQPPTTLASWAFLLFLAGLALTIRHSHAHVSLGILWFLGGHTLESTVLPLELLFEHRNYLPSFGIILTATLILLHATYRTRLRRLAGLMAVLVVAALAVSLQARAAQWSHEELFLRMEVQHHPTSHRNHAMLAQYYATHVPAADSERVLAFAEHHFLESLRLHPSQLSSRFALLVMRLQHQRPIDGNAFGHLLQRLEQDKLTPSAINGLRGLTRCLSSMRCQMPHDAYSDIIHAMKTNPTSIAYMADIDAYAGQFFGYVANDFKAALEFSRSAVERDPKDLALNFDIVRWLIMRGSHHEALAELRRLRARDTYGLFGAAIAEWESRISDLMSSERPESS